MSVVQQGQARHLLRRFGLGASPKDVRALEGLSRQDAVESLLAFEGTAESYPVSPWEFTTNTANTNLNTNSRNFGDWWALKMCTTTRPLEEKLTLFWHDHFAVSDEKVQDGRKMLQYLEVLRTNCAGNFAELLDKVSKTPAMILWLDSNQNIKGRPNENFAREVMELFTLGVDQGYTEHDIQEAARALTGWTFRDTLNYRDRQNNPIEQQTMEKVKQRTDIFEFFQNVRNHETGEKTIFGKSGDFDGDGVLRLLLDHPSTARYICEKLWEWFAYPSPEPEIVDRLAATFRKADYEIKPVLREIADHPAFWSDKSVRKKVKSPVDFTVGVMRQFGAASLLETRPSDPPDPFTPIDGTVRQFARIVGRQLERQGLQLLWPPSVEGWHWETEWINTELMLYRIDLARQFFANRRLAQPMVELSIPEFAVDPSRTADVETVDRLLALLDVSVRDEQRFALARHAREIGLNNALYGDRRNATDRVYQILKAMFALPEMHVC